MIGQQEPPVLQAEGSKCSREEMVHNVWRGDGWALRRQAELAIRGSSLNSKAQLQGVNKCKWRTQGERSKGRGLFGVIQPERHQEDGGVGVTG